MAYRQTIAHPPLANSSWPRAVGNEVDRAVRPALGRATGSQPVVSALLAAGDWGLNLLVSPGRQFELASLAFEYATRVALVAARRSPRPMAREGLPPFDGVTAATGPAREAPATADARS